MSHALEHRFPPAGVVATAVEHSVTHTELLELGQAEVVREAPKNLKEPAVRWRREAAIAIHERAQMHERVEHIA